MAASMIGGGLKPQDLVQKAPIEKATITTGMNANTNAPERWQYGKPQKI
jgi:hypothetical protein